MIVLRILAALAALALTWYGGILTCLWVIRDRYPAAWRLMNVKK